MAKDIVTVVVDALNEAGIKPTKSSVTYYYLKSLKESYRRLRSKHTLMKEGADLDPEQVQGALEDAVGQLSTLQDFLNPDNMKRFEAAAEFIPQLEEFFGSLNTHFEVQKQKEEEAAAEAEAAAAQAEEEAAAKAEEDAAEAEAAADKEAAEQDAEAAKADAEAEAPPEDAAPADKAEAEPPEEPEEPADPEPPEESPEAEEPEALEEGMLRRWKTLANIRG